MRTITTRVGQLTYNKDQRILYVRIFDGAEIELADAIQQWEAAQELTSGEKYLKFVEGSSDATASKEAREYAATIKPQDGRIAEALVVKSTATKLIGNFYINFNKPKIPTKVFSSPERAVEWLNGFLFLTDMNLLLEKKRLKKTLI